MWLSEPVKVHDPSPAVRLSERPISSSVTVAVPAVTFATKLTSAAAAKVMPLKRALAVLPVADASSGLALYWQLSVTPGATTTLVAPPPQSTTAMVPSLSWSLSDTVMLPGDPAGFDTLMLPETA